MPCFIYCTEQRNYSSHKNAKKHSEMAWQYNVSNARADSEILKMGGALCPPPWLDDEENFGFQMVLKKRFWQNTSFSIFKFSPFLYLMKACLTFNRSFYKAL